MRVHTDAADELDGEATTAADEAADAAMARDVAAHNYAMLLGGKASMADLMSEIEAVRATPRCDCCVDVRAQATAARPLGEHVGLRRRGWSVATSSSARVAHVVFLRRLAQAPPALPSDAVELRLVR